MGRSPTLLKTRLIQTMFNPLFRIKSVLITTRKSDPQGFILEDLITSFCLNYQGTEELQTKQFTFLRFRIVIIRTRPYALPIP